MTPPGCKLSLYEKQSCIDYFNFSHFILLPLLPCYYFSFVPTCCSAASLLLLLYLVQRLEHFQYSPLLQPLCAFHAPFPSYPAAGTGTTARGGRWYFKGNLDFQYT